ncbi:MAG: type II secretion system protein [Syntrophorhabdus sp.]
MRRVGGSSRKLLGSLRMLPSSPKTQRNGFTSIELIIVILVLSMLSAMVIVKNPFSVRDYSSIASDQLIANIRLTQLNAMGMKRVQSITFFVDSSDYGVYDLSGVRKKLPGDITVSPSSTITNPLTFNSLGEPSSSGIIYLSGGRNVTVHPSTGKVE